MLLSVFGFTTKEGRKVDVFPLSKIFFVYPSCVRLMDEEIRKPNTSALQHFFSSSPAFWFFSCSLAGEKGWVVGMYDVCMACRNLGSNGRWSFSVTLSWYSVFFHMCV